MDRPLGSPTRSATIGRPRAERPSSTGPDLDSRAGLIAGADGGVD